jgi:hypothetical protein
LQRPYCSLRRLSWKRMGCFPAGGNRSLFHAPPDMPSCVLFRAARIPKFSLI